MDKINNKRLIEALDAVVILNDNYAEQGIKKGYVGTVIENLIDEMGILLVDFIEPYTGNDIKILAEIKADDCRYISIDNDEDKKLGMAFREMFRK